MDKVKGSFFNFVKYPPEILAENTHAQHLQTRDKKDRQS